MWKMTRAVLAKLPLITMLTGFAYCAGVEFRLSYWRAIGLPLMASDRPFAEMLREGLLGLIFAFAQVLKIYSIWSWIVGAALLFGFATFAFRRAESRALNWLRRKALTRRLRDGYEPSKASARFDVVDHFIDHADKVIQPSTSIVFLLGTAALAVLLPWAAVGERGTEQGLSALARYEDRYRQLRDGLVDVPIVAIRTYPSDAVVEAIPMDCQGDRCAAMTSSGPISLMKDRFLQESVARAVWDDTCRRAGGRGDAPSLHPLTAAP